MFTNIYIYIGVGILFGYLLPSVNGPYDILKKVRDHYGKPFSCPVCSAFWSVIAASLLTVIYTPLITHFLVALSSAGFVLLIQNITKYNILFPGMDD